MKTPNDIQILLVEDNALAAQLTMRALEKRNFTNKLLWVKDGAEALVHLFGGIQASSRPKVILLDLKLPKVDGLEVLRRIKADERTRVFPVVVLTSSHDEQDVVRSYDLGVNSYIVKPANFENFSEAVANWGMYWLLLNDPPA
jgi:two-component system response regulator